jgi:hypothetical protein
MSARGGAIFWCLLAASPGCVHHDAWKLYVASFTDGPGPAVPRGEPLDEATCKAACETKPPATLRCLPLTQERPPARATRTLECSLRGRLIGWVEVAPELVAGADAKTGALDHHVCMAPCGANAIEEVNSCSVAPEPPVPPADMRLVLCEYTYPGWVERVDVLEPFRSLSRPPP